MAICLTAGEQSTTHAGMELNGNGISRDGYTLDDLQRFQRIFELEGINTELHYLHYVSKIETEILPEAYLLIIRDGVKLLLEEGSEALFNEQTTYNWDTQYWDNRRQCVLNKRARYNVCYGERGQIADYQNKLGTIIEYKQVPLLYKWLTNLEKCLGELKGSLRVEGNNYYNIEKCGIGFHGDSERKKVIGCSLGASRPIHWQWYHNSKRIGDRLEYDIHHGDMYIMSEKTSGWDWKKRNKYTLRHAAGVKYTK